MDVWFRFWGQWERGGAFEGVGHNNYSASYSFSVLAKKERGKYDLNISGLIKAHILALMAPKLLIYKAYSGLNLIWISNKDF
jgi:hypothetical protein